MYKNFNHFGFQKHLSMITNKNADRVFAPVELSLSVMTTGFLNYWRFSSRMKAAHSA